MKLRFRQYFVLKNAKTMIKSVTIKDKKGVLLFKIIHRKSGFYDVIKHVSLQDFVVEVRDEKGHKVIFGEEKR